MLAKKCKSSEWIRPTSVKLYIHATESPVASAVKLFNKILGHIHLDFHCNNILM